MRVLCIASRLGTLLGAAIGLAACGMNDLGTAEPAWKEPRPEAVQYAHVVRFSPADDRLSGAEREALMIFLANARVDGSDRVGVVGGGPDARLRERRQETVAAYLSHLGVATGRFANGFGLPAPEGDAAAVVVRRTVVTLPGCPDWSDRPGVNYRNAVHSNWGCATAINLGLMVADPADLRVGRAEGPGDGEYLRLSIERYHKGETKPLAPEDVGKVQESQKAGATEEAN